MADILSGCYWSSDSNAPDGNAQAGYIYILAGKEGNDFSEAKPLMSKPDEWKKRTGLQIATEKNLQARPLTNIPLTQEQLENYAAQGDVNWSNICTAQFAADFDSDGDLDLVVGAMGSEFYLHINSAESANKEPIFADAPMVLGVELPDQHADPHLVDWDSDGDLDLLSGGSTGSVFLSINKGTADEPKWSEFEYLVESEGKWSQFVDDESDIVPGHGSRVWVTDFNRDGKLDLLVGDSIELERKIPGLTKEKAAQMEAEYNEEMGPVQDEMQKIGQRYMDELEQARKDGEPVDMVALDERFSEEAKDLSEKMDELQEKARLFKDGSSTGHVWLYLQK